MIESLTPVEPEMAERLQFDASELIQRLDDLLVDVRDLRERVHHLASIVGDDTVTATGTAPDKPKKKKHKNKKHKKKSKARND